MWTTTPPIIQCIFLLSILLNKLTKSTAPISNSSPTNSLFKPCLLSLPKVTKNQNKTTSNIKQNVASYSTNYQQGSKRQRKILCILCSYVICMTYNNRYNANKIFQNQISSFTCRSVWCNQKKGLRFLLSHNALARFTTTLLTTWYTVKMKTKTWLQTRKMVLTLWR